MKPVLFNTNMVQAILNDRKDRTRRIIKGYIPEDAIWGYTIFTPKGYISCRGTFVDGYGEKFFKLPYNKEDIMYVRETVWQKIGHYLDIDGETKPSWYKEFKYVATDEKPKTGWNYSWVKRPSIHMPKEAARIFLKVKDIRVERLQDITEEQAKAEGAIDNRGFIHSPDNEYANIHTAKEHFEQIWNSTIKKSDLNCYGWEANPWVWVIDFEKCDKLEII